MANLNLELLLRPPQNLLGVAALGVESQAGDSAELEGLQITSLIGFSLDGEIQIKAYKSRENWIFGTSNIVLRSFTIPNIDSEK